ncbi:pleckstrin homology domain-containing family J member 1 [Cephus cinctus]|uniref:Pleckstrin homology domain-containing family J member 1 n=1 Tax=Cephus cinctus TaxID=211228 RepID=A0AAJ7BFX4_CEPCN|nr:pleckstrin homology domain-containing family J member 1 [Cephus cinctus]
MKFNEKELAEASSGPAELEGRLNHKRAHKSGFKERWFKLKGNLLFYFNTNEFGQIDKRQPTGVIILENCNVNVDTSDGVFAFSITFRDEHEKRHVLSVRTESQVEQWVTALRQASYEYWRSKLIVLQERLCKKTGKDPLLMYPRNQGVVRDEAWEATPTFRSHVRSFKSSVVPSSTLNTITREVNLIEFS